MLDVNGLQVRIVGEQLVSVGGSHGWGPANLTDEQVQLISIAIPSLAKDLAASPHQKYLPSP